MDRSPGEVPPREILRQRVDAELGSGWALYVAARGPRIVGMLALLPGTATLDQLFVATAERGTGAGRALLNAAKQKLPAGFTLRMDAANERARRFYEAEGLEKTGEGVHPRTRIPVHHYAWHGLPGLES